MVFVGDAILGRQARQTQSGSGDAIRDAATGRNLFTLNAHPVHEHTEQEAVFAGILSPNGRKLAAGGTDFMAKVWDVSAGRILLPPKGHEGHETSISCLAP